MIIVELLSYITHESGGIIGAALGGILMHIFHRGWDAYKERRRRKASEVIPRLVNADLLVYQDLTQLLVETGADRAYVMQFHNGVFYLNQVNHMKVSCTHEIVREGIARVQDTMQDILISKFTGQLTEMLKYGVAIFDADNQPESYYKNLIKSHGTGRSVAAAMIDGNVVEGSVVINYLQDNELIKSQNFGTIKEATTRAAEAISFKLKGKK